jgi:hypothetical protein
MPKLGNVDGDLVDLAPHDDKGRQGEQRQT